MLEILYMKSSILLRLHIVDIYINTLSTQAMKFLGHSANDSLHFA